jgi:hypothetical protein
MRPSGGDCDGHYNARPHRIHLPPRAPRKVSGAQFTCFTSTKVLSLLALLVLAVPICLLERREKYQARRIESIA